MPEGLTALDPFPRPAVETVDMWWPRLEEPVRVTPRAVDEGLVALNPATLAEPTVDSWDGYAPDMVPGAARPLDEGLAAFDPFPIEAPDVPLDRWQVPVSEPVRVPPRPVDEGLQVEDPSPTIVAPLPAVLQTRNIRITARRTNQARTASRRNIAIQSGT